MREKIFSVTLDDCDVQTFSAGGPGGQNVNRRSTAVRIIHRASGARGESREHRNQLSNKKAAFKRMTDTQIFKQWLYAVTHNLKTPSEIEAEVLTDLADSSKIKTEVKDGKKWVETDSI